MYLFNFIINKYILGKLYAFANKNANNSKHYGVKYLNVNGKKY